MNRLAKIARSAPPGTGVKFRPKAYGNNGIRQFLRDVIGMANAAVEGPRYIVVGVGTDAKGGKRLSAVPQDDFSGKPAYQDLVSDYIEPPIRVDYRAVTLDGKCLGVFEIADCKDRPYMMCADFSETLRRGDAYIRIDNACLKMGLPQLQELFERKFRNSVSAERVEIGFPGDIIHKYIKINTVDLDQLPSAIAGRKLKQFLDTVTSVKNSGSTTTMARLMHARLFGSENPYQNRSTEELLAEMELIKDKHRQDDDHFLFETNARELQLVVYNQGEQAIRDASLSVVMPYHEALHVASQLPMRRRNGAYVPRAGSEIAGYPAVTRKGKAVRVSRTIVEIPSFSPVNAFATPLRICVGSNLTGKRLPIHYSLVGRNLLAPAKGTLRLIF